MIKRIFLSFVLVFSVVCSSYSQHNDSLVFAGARWTESSLSDGIVLKQFHFTDSILFNSNQYISILEIRNDKDWGFHIVADTILRRTSEMAAEQSAFAAINGSFFRYNMPYNSVDYLRIGRMRLAPNSYGDNGERLFHQSGAVIINSGRLDIGKADLSDDKWESHTDGDDILTSGPLLIYDKTREKLKDESFYTLRHPRTAIGAKGDSLIFFVTIDGRAAEASGMSLKELQSVFAWLGADKALNLDGGGSTTMFLDPKGVVNHPTDNRQFDNQGERKVANIVIVKRR